MIRGIAAWLLAMVLLASAAHAHGGVGMVDKRCVLRIGPDIMFFTGFQPQNSREEFCDDFPSSGQTVVVLDMQEPELRDMLTEIRIIRDEGNHTTMNGLPFLTDAELESPQVLDAATITHVLPKKYPTGTLTFEHTFPQTGKFIGIVTVENGHGQIYVTQFPFSVGQGFGKSRGIYASSAFGLLEKTDYLPLMLLAIAVTAIFLMKDRTKPSIRAQQDEQKREKEEAEAAARERQRQQEEQYHRHDSSSGKMSADQALEILGLKSGATEEEIRAAYNRLMKRVHPDVGGSSVFAKQLNRARDVLIE